MDPGSDGSNKKFAVVTGPTSGFGREVAGHLAGLGFDLCLVARDAGRAGELADELSARGSEVTVIIADLSSISEADRAGAEIAALGRPIDLLVNNAGAVFGLRRRESVDGIELTMALNHFGYVALTRRVLANVEAARGRIINVASDAYEFAGGRLDFDDWSATRRYRPHRQYGRSKLANILFTRELARRVRDGVEVVAWSPAGLTATRFAYGANPLAPLAMKLTHPFSLSTNEAVGSLLELCDRTLTGPEQGAFFVDRTIDPVEVAPASDASRLWSVSEEVLEEILGNAA